MGLKTLKQKLKEKFKRPLPFPGPGANRNQSHQDDSQSGLQQQLEDQDNTQTSILTSSDSLERVVDSLNTTPAPTGSQPAPSFLPGGASRESRPEPLAGDTPIHELWNLAYENLRESDEELIERYEKTLRNNFANGLGSSLSLTLSSRADRRDHMSTILQRKMDEVNRDAWKLKFGSSEVQVKDLVQPVLGVVYWANEYITAAVSANPTASKAWGGISLLLPVSKIASF